MTFCYALRHDRCVTLKILLKHGLFFVALHKTQFKKKNKTRKVTDNSTYFGNVCTCLLIPWSCKDSCICWGSGADRSSEFAWTIHRDKGEPESKSCRKDWYLSRAQGYRNCSCLSRMGFLSVGRFTEKCETSVMLLVSQCCQWGHAVLTEIFPNLLLAWILVTSICYRGLQKKYPSLCRWLDLWYWWTLLFWLCCTVSIYHTTDFCMYCDQDVQCQLKVLAARWGNICDFGHLGDVRDDLGLGLSTPADHLSKIFSCDVRVLQFYPFHFH